MVRSTWGGARALTCALVLLAACSTKASSPPPAGKAVDAAAAPRGPDLAAMTRDVTAAAASGDASAVLAAIAKQCGGSCPCLDPARGGDAACAVDALGPQAAGVPPAWAWAGKFVADLAAHASDAERAALAGALAGVVAWAPPASPAPLPAATRAADPGAWGVVVIAEDGALSVGGAARIRLSLDGATADAAAPLAPVADPEAARAALAAIDPRRTSDAAGAPPVAAGSPCAALGGASGDGDRGQLGPGHRGGLGTRPRVVVVAGGAGGVVVLAAPQTPIRRLIDLLRATYGDKRLGVLAGGRVAALPVAVCDGASLDTPVHLDVEAGAAPADVRAAYEHASPPASGAAELGVSTLATAADLVGAVGALLDAGATRIAVTPVGTVNGHIAHEPAMHLARPTIVGELDAMVVRRWIKRSGAALVYCYTSELFESPSLEGEATATFTVGPTGAVAKAKVTGLTPAFDACAVKVLRAVRFPAPRGGQPVEVTYPITFDRSAR